MDKELIRVIIIFAGLVVIAGMIIWGMVKNRRAERKNYYGEKYADEDDEVDVVPLGSAVDEEPYEDYLYKSDAHYAYQDEDDDGGDADYGDAYSAPQKTVAESEERRAEETAALPEVVQFSIVSKELQGFNGMQLAVAFKAAGLTFGSRKIFEYLDANGDAVFSVASINEPGTFPESGLDKFYCPGIVCFMQPEYLADPVAVFDHLIATLHKLSKQLDGVEWDHKRKALSEETIAALREQLF